MRAKVGDWLVVNSHVEGHPVRRAVITAAGAEGEPPYRVRWTDTDHEGLVFPGPDAEVVSAAAQVERDHAESERIKQVQAAIIANTGER